MALPILDGNQSATTLSTILDSGQHIPAHTVVSLGSTAISNITSAVSGSVVSVSNFPASQSTTFGAVTGSVSVLNLPATQTVAGTVTATVRGNEDAIFNEPSSQYTLIRGLSHWYSESQNEAKTTTENNPLPISGTVTVGNSVTIGASSVTFNSYVAKRPDGTWQPLSVESGSNYVNARVYPSDITPFLATVTVGNSITIGSLPAISGTVTANAGAGFSDAVYSGLLLYKDNEGGFNVESLPAISGTVTAAAPNGTLTTRFGSVTTANTSFASSAVTNANRKYLLIQNVTTASNVITVGIGFTPTTTQGIQLTAGAGITFESSYIPTGAVYVLSSVTASNFTILEA